MKYLKSYRIFESYFNDNIRGEMSDILSELKDNGYAVTIHPEGTTGDDCHNDISPGDSISIWIGKGTTSERTSGLTFAWSDIKSVIDQLKSYLSDRYYISHIKANFNGYEQEIEPELSRQQYTTVTVTFTPKGSASENEYDGIIYIIDSREFERCDFFYAFYMKSSAISAGLGRESMNGIKGVSFPISDFFKSKGVSTGASGFVTDRNPMKNLIKRDGTTYCIYLDMESYQSNISSMDNIVSQFNKFKTKYTSFGDFKLVKVEKISPYDFDVIDVWW